MSANSRIGKQKNDLSDADSLEMGETKGRVQWAIFLANCIHTMLPNVKDYRLSNVNS
jgi:hypothetical protein